MAISKKVRFEILKRDQFRCAYCGRQPKEAELHIDHKKPTSKGGSDSPANLITACDKCNYGKHNHELSANLFVYDLGFEGVFLNWAWIAVGKLLDSLAKEARHMGDRYFDTTPLSVMAKAIRRYVDLPVNKLPEDQWGACHFCANVYFLPTIAEQGICVALALQAGGGQTGLASPYELSWLTRDCLVWSGYVENMAFGSGEKETSGYLNAEVGKEGHIAMFTNRGEIFTGPRENQGGAKSPIV